MKKFTDNKTIQPHYAGNEVLKNQLFDLIEETLTPNIDGIDSNNLTISGKEDLVLELIKIVENSGIDASIDLLKEIKPGEKKMVNKEIESLMEAFNKVNEAKTEEERAMNHFKIDEKGWADLSDKEKKEKIDSLPERKGKNN